MKEVTWTIIICFGLSTDLFIILQVLILFHLLHYIVLMSLAILN